MRLACLLQLGSSGLNATPSDAEPFILLFWGAAVPHRPSSAASGNAVLFLQNVATPAYPER